MSYRKRKKTSWKDGGGSKGSKGMSKGGFESKTPEERLNEMREKVIREDALDARFGFVRFGVDESNKKLGWLMNMHPTLQPDSETGALKSCLDLYFIQEDGRTFKATVPHEPYFYVGVKNGALRDVEAILRRRLPRIGSLSYNSKEDLDLKNHLSGLQKKYLRVSFHTVQDLVAARAILAPIVARNQKKASGEVDVFEKKEENVVNAEQLIEDIREYDVPYYIRTAIDLEYRVGLWYEVSLVHGMFSFFFFSIFSFFIKKKDIFLFLFIVKHRRCSTKEKGRFDYSRRAKGFEKIFFDSSWIILSKKYSSFFFAKGKNFNDSFFSLFFFSFFSFRSLHLILRPQNYHLNFLMLKLIQS